VEALIDSISGLTTLLLTRKQSVLDAEHLFHPEFATFMEEKGYHFEARTICYIRVVWNWEMSVDSVSYSARNSITGFLI